MHTIQWPNERRCAVSLTFDLDGEVISYLVDPENAHKRLTLMSESAYGPKVGIHHILELLDLYEIKASFFIPGWVVELHPDIAKNLLMRGHDVGHHGYMHERPDSLSAELEEKVLLKGIEVIEAATGERPTGYRSPAWELKPTTPALLLRNGFKYDSSLMGYDIPYWVDTPAGRLLELPVSWRLDDFPQFGYMVDPSEGSGMSAPSKGLEVFTEEFNGLFARGGYFNMTMHPYLAGRPSGLIVLERLIRHIRAFPRVWWAPLSKVAAYCYTPAVAVTLPVETTEIPEPKWIT